MSDSVLGADVMLKKDHKDDSPNLANKRPAMPPRRTSVRVKNAAIFSLEIPEVLSNKFSIWYQTHLLFQNYLVTTFRASGTHSYLLEHFTVYLTCSFRCDTVNKCQFRCFDDL